MDTNNGLSQQDRINRIAEVKPFEVIDCSMESLLRQAEEIAGFIRYYNPDNLPDGAFAPFLQQLHEIREQGPSRFTPDGNMEPSQALLYVFLQQLHQAGRSFNERWQQLPDWYLQEILRVKAPRMFPDFTCISLGKNTAGELLIPKGTRFTCGAADGENRLLYRTADDLILSDVEVAKLNTLYFEHHPQISPAKELGWPVAVQMKEVLRETNPAKMLFEPGEQQTTAEPLGLQISCGVLLLREGKRRITLIFEFEKMQLDPALSGERVYKFMNQAFFLEISTQTGWSKIPRYALEHRKEEETGSLTLTFELPEAFPATTACDVNTHRIGTRFPALRILLNRDAWVFPYAWIKKLNLSKIFLNTQVEGVSDLLFYNDLGKVDISLPFAPFGMNTERGAHFTVGNYEMAVKKINTADLHIRWQQLPDDEKGFASYYQAYEKEQIDNTSFRVSSHLLSDYKWKSTPDNQSLLFATERKGKDAEVLPTSKLAPESVIPNIQLREMNPVRIPEELYEYNLRAESGFIHFTLDEPAMGFGGKRYRQLFQESLMKNSLRRKPVPLPNSPVTPLIERITLSYSSSEEINLLAHPASPDFALHHISPFGASRIYPNREFGPLPFVFSMAQDANLLFGLKNVKGEECVSLFIEFFSHCREIEQADFPVVSWYWGDGYHWKRLPDDALLRDTTRNLVMNGMIKIYIPETMGAGDRDAEGLTWLCAGVVKNEASIPAIKNISSQVVQVFRNPDQVTRVRPDEFQIDACADSFPGIAQVKQVAPFSKGMNRESPREKLIRVSEYISHRGAAVTARDYERIVLQAFPQIRKVKCFAGGGFREGGEAKVSLAVIPYTNGEGAAAMRPQAGADLLLGIEAFLSGRVPEYVVVDATSPVYEEIKVRCSILYGPEPHNRAYVRSNISQTINQYIAPWQYREIEPEFDYSFTVRELARQVEKLKQVEKVVQMSIIQLIPRGREGFEIKEYPLDANADERVKPFYPHGFLVPSGEHTIKQVTEPFGIDEMKINENFVVWPNETGKR